MFYSQIPPTYLKLLLLESKMFMIVLNTFWMPLSVKLIYFFSNRLGNWVSTVLDTYKGGWEILASPTANQRHVLIKISGIKGPSRFKFILFKGQLFFDSYFLMQPEGFCANKWSQNKYERLYYVLVMILHSAQLFESTTWSVMVVLHNLLWSTWFFQGLHCYIKSRKQCGKHMEYSGFALCLKLTYVIFGILLEVERMENKVSFHWQELEMWVHSAAFYCFALGKPLELTTDSYKWQIPK